MFEDFVDEIINDQIQFRRKLHRMAEVSGEENRTADAIAKFLESTNPDQMVRQIGGDGLVAVYEGEQEGPTVMIRSELDALPIQESNSFDHRSENEGVSHKCGHDGHMSIAAGIGAYLAKNRPKKGKVMLLFQPAEETGRGAGRVLQDQKFKELQPDYIFALHNLPGFPKHQVVIRDDVFASASKGLILKLQGETSHAAHPKDGRSPALASAQIIETLSSIPQFYTSLHDSAKVTIIYSRLGEQAFGTSPGYAEVAATLRTYYDDDMQRLERKAVDLSRGLARTYDLEVEHEWTEPFKATINNKEANEVIRKVVRECDYEMIEPKTPFAWSEDFGRFLDQFDGALFGLGSGTKHPQLHADNYDFPDEIIHTGLNLFLGIINSILDLNN